MKSLVEQLSLFNNPAGGEDIRINDEVKILPINEKKDPLSYNYFKHYYPHCINKIGRVIAVQGNSLTVLVRGEQIIVNKSEVQFIR